MLYLPGSRIKPRSPLAGLSSGDHGLSFPVTFNEGPATAAANNFNESFASEQVTTTPLCNQDSQGNQDQVLNQQGCANS